MTIRIHPALFAAAWVCLPAAPSFGQTPDAAQVIFTNDKLTVIDAKGVERKVKQGDYIQAGERVLTPPGIIGQIRLPDGTLLGARPGSDLKLEGITKSLVKNVLILNEGNVRVINVTPPKGQPPHPIEVISPISTLQITAGDGEAIHIKPGSKPNVEPGTYNRLQFGTAIVRNEKGERSLPPMEPVFSPKLGAPLVPITTLPTSLVKLEPVFTTSLVTPTLPTTSLTTDLKVISPTITTSMLTSPTLATSPPDLQKLASPTLITAPLSPTGAIGTAPTVGSTTPVISQTLTPVYSFITPTIISTAALKPPPPPPPPPPKIITCKTCLFIKR